MVQVNLKSDVRRQIRRMVDGEVRRVVNDNPPPDATCPTTLTDLHYSSNQVDLSGAYAIDARLEENEASYPPVSQQTSPRVDLATQVRDRQ